jgi:hypothetical protein
MDVVGFDLAIGPIGLALVALAVIALLFLLMSRGDRYRAAVLCSRHSARSM